MARIRATMPIGTFTKKIHRHEKLVTMMPPMTGPRMGPSSVGTPMRAMTLFIFSGPALRAMIACPTGMIRPPPKPCRTRKAIREEADQASPHRIEPPMKSIREVI